MDDNILQRLLALYPPPHQANGPQLASVQGGAPYGIPRDDGISALIKQSIEQQRTNGRPFDPRGAPVTIDNEWIEDPSMRGLQTPFGNFLRRT